MKRFGSKLRIVIILIFVGWIIVRYASGGEIDFSGSEKESPAYHIKNYDVNMVVNDNNSYDITETMDVFFTEERHGIIRYIPRKTYMNRYAKVGNGRVEGYKFNTGYDNNQYVIRIGDPDVFVTGDQKYIISYKYNLGFDALIKMDELYYNIIGTGHNVRTENVTFTITMPKSFDASNLNFTYGKSGSTESSGVDYTVIGNTITGALKEGLNPNEALTVALQLEEGYFVNTWRDTNIKALIGDYYEYIYLFFLILAIILWGIWCKNRIICPTVEFYAPNNYNPTEVGFIYDGEIDPYDVTALIIYWANKGKLMIEERIENVKKAFGTREKSTLTFYKIEELGSDFKDYENKIFDTMFNVCGNGQNVTVDQLKKAFGSSVSEESIKSSMQNDKETRIFSKSARFAGMLIKLAALLNAFCFFIVIVYGIGNARNHGLAAIILAVLLCIPIWSFTKFLTRWNNIIPRFRFKKVLDRLFWLVLSFVLAYLLAFNFSNTLMYISGYAVCFLISLLSSFSLKRTEYGDRQNERILGFKEFIENAEKDRIEMLVTQNPEYFFDVLPYAMALGITDKWARNFEDIMISPPAWYSSSSLSSGAFNMYSFVDNFNTNTSSIAEYISSAIDAANAPTISSGSGSSDGGYGGSSDGGSAGGGSGGGGSDDW